MKIKYKITSSGELANPEKNYYLNYDKNEKILPSATQPIGIYENNNLSIALNLSGNLKTESFYNKIDEKIKIKKNYKKNVIELKKFNIRLNYYYVF